MMYKSPHLLIKRILLLELCLCWSISFGQENQLEKEILTVETLMEQELFDSAWSLVNQTYLDMNENTEPALKSRCLYLMGKTNYYLNEYDVAETYYYEALQHSLSLKDTTAMADISADLGRMYNKMGEFSNALQSFNRAQQYYYALGDSSGMATMNLNVGNVFKSINHADKAKKEYFKALNYFIRSGDTEKQASCYNNLGNVYKNENQLDSAFHYMYKTLELRKKGDSKTGLSYIYHNLANLHLRNKNTDSALYYISESAKLKTEIGLLNDLAYDYNVFGSIYIELKDWTKAIYYLEMANQIEIHSALTANKLDILRLLGMAYYNQGNKSKAADYMNQYITGRDSLVHINQDSFLETELINYQLYTDSIKIAQLSLERDLELLRNENAELANSINFRNYLYAVIILSLVIAIIAILLISARRRLAQTEAHETVLSQQNEELKRTLISKEEKEILLKEIHHRVKNNLQIINSLIRLQSNFITANNYREKLMETENRIRSMALIHEKLYKTGNLGSLSVRNYIEELAFNILESYDNPKVKIKLKFDLEEREYGIDTLIPLGLIINEVLSNSLKHAFFERVEGHIFISIKSFGDQSIMEIKDDGIGADLSFEELKEDSLGMELISSLTDQLDGELELNSDHGFAYRFTFKILK